MCSNQHMPYLEKCAKCERLEQAFIRTRSERSIRFFQNQLADSDQERLSVEEYHALGHFHIWCRANPSRDRKGADNLPSETNGGSAC